MEQQLLNTPRKVNFKPTGKAKVQLLVQSGMSLANARKIVYKKQYAYGKRTNYAAQRKYDSKKLQEWHL